MKIKPGQILIFPLIALALVWCHRSTALFAVQDEVPSVSVANLKARVDSAAPLGLPGCSLRLAIRPATWAGGMRAWNEMINGQTERKGNPV